MKTAPCIAAILLVDDDEMNRQLATRMLSKFGYSDIATATNGIEAVEACLTRRFDLVLMDCEMPVMDGFEAARKIRDSADRSPIIIAFTATATSLQKFRCAQAGMNDFLPKPLDLSALRTMLQRWLGQAEESGYAPALSRDKPPDSE